MKTRSGASTAAMLGADASLATAHAVLDTYRTQFIWPRKRRILWFLDLLRFATKLRASKLLMYCEDALVGLLADNCWVDVLVVADELQAWNLRCAALQFGVRQIAPFVFLRFFGKHRPRAGAAEAATEKTAANATGGQRSADVFQTALSTTEARLLRKDHKHNRSAGTTNGTPAPPKNPKSPKGAVGLRKASEQQSDQLIANPTSSFALSLQSDIFKANELEAFLFDLDLPHCDLGVLTEYFNSNVLKELKQRRPLPFQELKDRLVASLLEFQRVEHAIDIILKKSVFAARDSQLTNLMETARRGFSSFFWVRSDKVAERAPENAPPHVLRQYLPKEKFLFGWLLAKYFWEIIVAGVLLLLWHYRFELQERVLLL